MRKTKLLLVLMTLLPLPVLAQGTHDPTVVRLVNCGKMHVAPSASANASLYVPDAVVVRDSSSILQNGITAIGGNFYQAAKSNVFALDAQRNFTRSTGKVRFVTNSLPSKQRTITVWNNVATPYTAATFNRGQYYIAFPDIEINTSDTIHVSSTLGMDSHDITRGAAGTNGVLYLESSPLGAQVHDASLRTMGTVVTPGSVVIEKHIKPFRHSSSGSAYLFPFASPYTNQRAGYFAGNWVRSPQTDANGSCEYPYANRKASSAEYIDESQYVRYAGDRLSAGSPYLLQLQPDGYAYDLPFIITLGENHGLDKFIFNGKPHNMPYSAEAKFTGNLFSRNAKLGSGKTQNWVIGNSYTSAISVDSLLKKVKTSGILFTNILYVYDHGATNYTTYEMDSYDGTNIPDIPAMSVFMLLISRTNGSTDAFTITPDMQIHSGSIKDHSGLPAPRHNENRLTFRLTPEDNPFIYDEIRMNLSEDAKLSNGVSKLLNASNQYFSLYISSASNKLQSGTLPLSSTSADLGFIPATYAMDNRLTFKGIESVNTEDLLLYDTKIDAWTDLRETNEYVFHSEPADSPDRFKIYFKSPTGVDPVAQTQAIYGYYLEENFYLNRLSEDDRGSHIKLFNASGSLVKGAIIDTYPQYRMSVSLPQGVYIAKIEGKNSAVIKFVKR